MEDHNVIEEILTRFFEGKTSASENEQIEAWLKEDEEHLRIAKQLNSLYLAVDTQNIEKKTNSIKALDKVKGKMRGKQLPWWEWALRVAAVLMLPLLAITLSQYFKGEAAKVVMLEARTNPGMTTSIVLPDSTVVCLNSESSLRYPSSFEGCNRRNVELKGEAFFKVTKNPDKHFIVRTSHNSQIEVLGTTFNVEAYENMPEVSTTLLKGKVDFYYRDKSIYKKVQLKPGQKVVYDSQNNLARLYETSGETESSWKDGKIILDNTSLKDVLHILSKRYNVAFKLTKDYPKDSFTGTFTNQRLELILAYFKLSSNIRWRYIDEKDTSKQHIEIY